MVQAVGAFCYVAAVCQTVIRGCHSEMVHGGTVDRMHCSACVGVALQQMSKVGTDVHLLTEVRKTDQVEAALVSLNEAESGMWLLCSSTYSL